MYKQMKLGQKKDRQSHSPSQLRPEVRERLELAVLQIFSTTDFHRANLREIAKRAGVSFASIYKYYGNKEGLLFGTIDTVLKQLTERLIDHLRGIENIKEKMRKAFWVELDFYERRPEVGRILFLTLPFRKWMEDKTYKQEKFINVYVDVLRQGQRDGFLNPNVRPGVFLDIMHGIVMMRFMMWIYRGQKESLQSNFDELFEMLWRAISNPDLDIDKA
jgi:AcrR family transcriptional regulator